MWERGIVEGKLAACERGKRVDLETWNCAHGSVEDKWVASAPISWQKAGVFVPVPVLVPVLGGAGPARATAADATSQTPAAAYANARPKKRSLPDVRDKFPHEQ